MCNQGSHQRFTGYKPESGREGISREICIFKVTGNKKKNGKEKEIFGLKWDSTK